MEINDEKGNQNSENIIQSEQKDLVGKEKIKTNFRLYSQYTNIDLGITSQNYADISYIKAEEVKNYLKSSSNHGLTGLKNIGNSSYINSIIQCLSNTPELMYYYISGLYKNDIKISEVKKKGYVPGKLSEEFANLLSKMWIDNKKVANPQDIKYAIADLNYEFNNNNQQDSSEFLIFLLNFLHDEINREKIKVGSVFYEPPKGENETDIAASQRFWNLFRRKNNSIIIDLFYGQIKNVTRCLTCGNSVTSFEVFNILPLEIPILKKISVLLVPSNNIKKTIKLTLFISSSALFIDLGVYIKQYINSGFENFRIILVNYTTTNAKFVKMSENIFNTAKKGVILIQEISNTLEEENNLEENDEKDNENNKENEDEISAEMGENFPFITTIKYKNFEDLGGIIDTNFKSYPRVFTMGPYTKIRGLRIKIFGFLCKYYPLPESVINLLKKNFSEYKTLEEIKKSYEKDKIDIDEIELNDIYYKQYNIIFNENYQKNLKIDEPTKKDIEIYLNNFPFKCYLISSKGENDKLFFSNNNEENQASLKDSQKINDIINLIRNKYKLILYITKEEYIKPLNEILVINSTKDNSETKIPTLNDALIHFSLHEKLEKENEYFCPNCKRNVNAYHKSEIFYAPPYLIMLIKRFQRKYLSKTKVQLLKINSEFKYNIDFINLEQYISGPKDPHKMYNLYAVNQHSGSNEGGHYNSACKNFGKWYMFDDHAVFPCDDDMICVPEGYILFYRKAKDNKKIEKQRNKNIFLEFYQKIKNGEKVDDKEEKTVDKNIEEDMKEVGEESEDDNESNEKENENDENEEK